MADSPVPRFCNEACEKFLRACTDTGRLAPSGLCVQTGEVVSLNRVCGLPAVVRPTQATLWGGYECAGDGAYR